MIQQFLVLSQSNCTRLADLANDSYTDGIPTIRCQLVAWLNINRVVVRGLIVATTKDFSFWLRKPRNDNVIFVFTAIDTSVVRTWRVLFWRGREISLVEPIAASFGNISMHIEDAEQVGWILANSRRTMNGFIANFCIVDITLLPGYLSHIAVTKH